MRWKSFALIIACTMLMIGSAFAQGIVVPGDSDGDKIVSAEEVAAAEKLAQEGKLSADELQEIKHIHEKYPITITDSANRTVTIYKPVKSILPMSATNCEPIFILGAADKIGGMRTDLQETHAWIPGITDKPTIGGWKEIDYEKVIEICPDLVITGASDVSVVENKLSPAGILFVVSSRSRSQDSFDKDLRLLSKILEKEDRAEEFFSWRQYYLDQLKEKINKIEPKDKIKVYCESNNQARSAPTNASGAHWAIIAAGGENIAGNIGKSTYADVESEWILKENPEAIVIAATMLNDPPGSYLDFTQEENDTRNLDQYLEMTCNRTELRDTNAVKMHRVYLLHGTYADFGRCFVGACYMAKWFYPEIFQDLNPDEINKEYCEKWLGVPYKGIWAYPRAS